VGSAEEARAAEAAGCDLVVAQGVEAGGHVRGTQPLDELLAEVLGAVSVPVVAAGGIGSAERVAQLVAAGADAVRVGTRQTAQWTELPATAPGGLSTIGPVEVAHAQPVSVICRSVDCSTEVRPSGTVCSSWAGQDEGRTGTCALG
jgi:imidazole glycerol phosphate synthase subunit HisF